MTTDASAGWDAEAASFDEAADHGLRDPAVRAAWRALLEQLLPAAPARVADLGCGTGTLELLMADMGYGVDGVDFSPAMLERARAKTAGRPGITVQLGDAAAPPLEDGAYDVVLSRHVLWALPDPKAGLERWIQLLAPGGRLVLVEGHWHTGAGLMAGEIRTLLAEIGRSADVVPLPDPALWGREITDERYAVVSPGR